MDKLLLIDGFSFIFRSFYALPPLRSSSDEPTGAIYGFLQMVERLLANYNPDYVYVVFDSPGKTHRHELFSEYKANRSAAPDDLIAQIQPIMDLVPALGLAKINKVGFEADDIIATLTKFAVRDNMQVYIASQDKDLAQLVNDQVLMVNTMTNKELDYDGVVNKFGVRPDQIRDFLSLVGDQSDGIIGIDKVGPKTAAKWLSQYHNIEGVIANKEAIKGKVGENLRSSIDILHLAYQLVTLDADVYDSINWQDAIRKEPDIALLAEYYETFSFTKKLASLDVKAVRNDYTYTLIDTQAKFDALVVALKNHRVVGFDTETLSLRPRYGDLCGISLAFSIQEGFYIPTNSTDLDFNYVLDHLKPIFIDPDYMFVAHNLKFDQAILGYYGIKIRNYADTMLMAYALDSSSGPFDLTSLALQKLNIALTKYKDIIKGYDNFSQVPFESAANYAAGDAVATFGLYQHYRDLLAKNDWAENVYSTVELPLSLVLSSMERSGIGLDTNELTCLDTMLTDKITTLQNEIYNQAGESFNISSTKQLGYILYEVLQLPVLAKTKSGKSSSSEEVLLKLADQHPIINEVLSFRTLTKLQSTYTSRLIKEANEHNGKVHCFFNQTGTVTGRLSSSEPNLQNIPVKGSYGPMIRKAFIAQDHKLLVACDYSQIELRVMAHLSRDPMLLDAFSKNQDIHTRTAMEIFQISADEVNLDTRRGQGY